MVLALKYRPQIFADLIGQEALVQTLTNAIAQNRLAHAYLLTGIRGVGKTSSARIIAKGLNCVGPDGKGGMTPNPCGQCAFCRAISNDADMDVIEIDAASNNGVDNVREIIEGARYAPVAARFKIYIIDEVHMLSKPAFNALLKTLEEPHERVKFILATTEIRKVPATIVSRCQRFDLRRVKADVLVAHLAKIVAAEGRQADTEALQLLAKMGDGSVRDTLSLLDQALTQTTDCLTLAECQKMVGLGDADALFELLVKLLHGDTAGALEQLAVQQEAGADALSCVQELLELVHWLTLAKVLPTHLEDIRLSAERRTKAKSLVSEIGIGVLTRIWQVLLRGAQEVRSADHPFMALEMVIIKLGYLADLPPLENIVADIKKSPPATSEDKKKITPAAEVILPPSEQIPAQITPQSMPLPKTWADIVALVRKHKEMILAFNMENFVRCQNVENTVITGSFIPQAPNTLIKDITAFLQRITGVSWLFNTIADTQNATLHEEKQQAKSALLHTTEGHPLVQRILTAFPGATITNIIANTDKEDDIEKEEDN